MNQMANTMPKWLSWFLKIFFKLLYNQFAWTYDIVSWVVSLGMWNDWIRVAIPLVKGHNILELGHGPGHLQKELFDGGYSPFGLDISTHMGRICQRRLGKIGYEPRLVNGTASSLPYPTNKFDFIVATFPTEYIIEENTINEIHRVLKQNGALLIIPEARFTGSNFIYKAAAWLFKVTGQALDEDDDRIYQRGKKLFEDAGFETQMNLINLPKSKVTVFMATKPD